MHHCGLHTPVWTPADQYGPTPTPVWVQDGHPPPICTPSTPCMSSGRQTSMVSSHQFNALTPVWPVQSPHTSTALYGPSTAQCKPVWPHATQHGLDQPSTNQYSPVWPSTAQYKPVQAYIAQLIPVQTSTALGCEKGQCWHIPARFLGAGGVPHLPSPTHHTMAAPGQRHVRGD